ncbi:MAG: NAD(+) synthase, partial [Pirellulaceae bacterium]
VCLPELCITGYGCEDAFLSPGLHREAWGTLMRLLPHTAGLLVTVGLPIAYRGVVFNGVAVVADGEILGIVPKQNLAGDGIHYEPRWFKPWPVGKQAVLEIEAAPYPLGDLVFRFGDILLGLEICEDAWVADRPGTRQSRLGVDIVLNPSASHFAFGKQEIRRRFVLEGSRAFHATYVYANLLGNEAGRAIYDGGSMIASAGTMLAEGERFSFDDFRVTAATVDLDLTRLSRAQNQAFRLDFDATRENVIVSDFRFPTVVPQPQLFERAAWERSDDLKMEEFTRAVTLSLFDYLRKSRSRGFVVSLSGGADSAAVAVLCAYMVKFALQSIGLRGLARKLNYIEDFSKTASPADIIAKLLICVYQATQNSSDTTHDAAKSLAETIGARFHRLEIDELVEGYVKMGAQMMGRELTWETDDIALQNIQARTRSPSVWLMANLTGSLLLSTSNRSEAAVGYATMDGDTSGGLSPIAGIDKAFLRQWLTWMEETGPAGIGCLPALSAINVQTPTAELRPPEQHQTDEADLMPYDLLDAIERAAIRDKQIPLEIFVRLREVYTQYTDDQLGNWVERFFRLWSRNQWKRERYAPSFHLDDENLDPKTWCRFPILSGGFEWEISEMWRTIRAASADDETSM